jgi:chromosome segregation ATPase
MSDNVEIFDFLRIQFARLEQRLDRVDTRLEKRSVHFAALQDRLNNFAGRLAQIERRLAAAKSELERAIRESEQLLNSLEVPEEPLRMPFWNEETQEYDCEPLARTRRPREGDA